MALARRLAAVASAAAALALAVLLGSSAAPVAVTPTLPPIQLPSPPVVGTPTLPPIQLPVAGIGLPKTLATGCNRFAAPTGSDLARGGPRAPFRSVQRLVDSLRPGQTGCLRAGTYRGSVRIARGGRGGARVTLGAYPGETATIVGRLEVVKGANYVTVTGLVLDGENPQHLESPMIDANHVTFSYDDVTNDHTGICFGIGSATWGWATGTLITHDRVHDCGQLPATNYQHGFYIGAATDTTIDHNIIDGNGEGIMVSGADGSASSYTNVYDNILSNATVRHDVESFWPAGNPMGIKNVVHENCVWRGRKGAISAGMGGLKVSNNARVNPMFVNAAAHDYELQSASPCLFAVGDVEAAVDGIAATIPLIKHTPFALSTGRASTRRGQRRGSTA